MLDEFEGMQYERIQTEVQLATGEPTTAWTYVMKERAKPE